MATLEQAPTSNFWSTSLNGAINDSVETITLNSTTGLQAPGRLIINRQDSSGANTPDSREVISFTGISGSDITGVTRAADNSTARSHADGSLVESNITVGNWGALYDVINEEHDTDGTHDVSAMITGGSVLDENDMASDSATALATQQSIKAYVDDYTRTKSIWLPAGSFQIAEGSPSLTSNGSIGAYWALDDSGTERVGINIITPADYASGNLSAYIYYTTLTGNAGNVVIRVRQGTWRAEDGTFTAASSDDSLTESVIATAGDLNISGAYLLDNGTPAANSVLALSCGRVGGEATDTLVGDLLFAGLRIDYLAKC